MFLKIIKNVYLYIKVSHDILLYMLVNIHLGIYLFLIFIYQDSICNKLKIINIIYLSLQLRNT